MHKYKNVCLYLIGYWSTLFWVTQLSTYNFYITLKLLIGYPWIILCFFPDCKFEKKCFYKILNLEKYIHNKAAYLFL